MPQPTRAARSIRRLSLALIALASMLPMAGLPMAGLPMTARADTAAASGAPGDVQGKSKSVCLRSMLIDHTAVPNDNTILFYMQGGKIWKNTLTDRCVGLRIEGGTSGFIYSPTNPNTDELCSNLQTIRLRQSGMTCFLGDFTPIDRDAAKALMKR